MVCLFFFGLKFGNVMPYIQNGCRILGLMDRQPTTRFKTASSRSFCLRSSCSIAPVIACFVITDVISTLDVFPSALPPSSPADIYPSTAVQLLYRSSLFSLPESCLNSRRYHSRHASFRSAEESMAFTVPSWPGFRPTSSHDAACWQPHPPRCRGSSPTSGSWRRSCR